MSIAPKNLVRLAAVAATVCAALLVFKLSDAPKADHQAPARSAEIWQTTPNGGEAETNGETTDDAASAGNAAPALSLPSGMETPPAHSFHVFYRGTRPAEYIRGDTLLVEGGSYLINDTSGGVPRTVAAIPISAAESITDTDSEVSNAQR